MFIRFNNTSVLEVSSHIEVLVSEVCPKHSNTSIRRNICALHFLQIALTANTNHFVCLPFIISKYLRQCQRS